MPMELERHEEILNDLNNPDLPATERAERLTELRADYGTVISEHNELTQNYSDSEATVKDLTLANSRLFRQLGTENRDPEKEQEQQEKTFSETITIEQLEGKR